MQVRPTLWGSILEAEDADDGLEHFKDQPDGEATEAYEASANDAAEAEAAPSEREADGAATSTAYDMSKRWEQKTKMHGSITAQLQKRSSVYS